MTFAFAYRFATRLLLPAGLAALLSACGQYGDLYLPEGAPAGKTQQQPVDTPQDDEKEQE